MTELAVFTVTFLAIGIGAYYLDAVYGSALYRAIYKWTHKDPLPEGERRGLIVNQNTRTRIPTALALTAFFCALMYMFGEHNFVTIMWQGLVEFVVLLIGFAAGGLLNRILRPAEKAARVLDVLDGLESGAIDPARKAADILRSGREKVVGAVRDISDARKAEADATLPHVAPAKTEVEASLDAEVPAPAPTPDLTFEEKVRRYESGTYR